jgi:hypothetical protein
MRHILRVLGSILLGEEAPEATPTDDNRLRWPRKMQPHALDVFHELVERIRLRARTTPVTTVIEREDAVLVSQRAVCLVVRSVVTYMSHVSHEYSSKGDHQGYSGTHSSAAVQSDDEWRTVRSAQATGQLGAVYVDEIQLHCSAQSKH